MKLWAIKKKGEEAYLPFLPTGRGGSFTEMTALDKSDKGPRLFWTRASASQALRAWEYGPYTHVYEESEAPPSGPFVSYTASTKAVPLKEKNPERADVAELVEFECEKNLSDTERRKLIALAETYLVTSKVLSGDLDSKIVAGAARLFGRAIFHILGVPTPEGFPSVVTPAESIQDILPD